MAERSGRGGWPDPWCGDQKPLNVLLHPTRHYERTDDLVQEIINARVWGAFTTGSR
jgi:hypothetical protein